MVKEARIEILESQLQDLLLRKTHLMRTLLGNMQAEQQVIELNDPLSMKGILAQRTVLIESLRKFREKLIVLGSHITQVRQNQEEHTKYSNIGDYLLSLFELLGGENPSLISLREQLLVLMNKIELQNIQNKSLLESRINYHREHNNHHSFEGAKVRAGL